MLATVVPAAGSGVRFGGDKVLAPVGGTPLLYLTISRLSRVDEVSSIVLVVPPGRVDAYREEHLEHLSKWGVTKIVAGGETRQDSVRAGLSASPPEAEMLLVHDAVRPNFSIEAANRAVIEARSHGAAILAVPVRDTLKRAGVELRVTATVSREGVWRAETPQVVRRDLYEAACAKAEAAGFAGTDEASLVEHYGAGVVLVRGRPWNIKVTEREDLAVLDALLSGREG